MSINVLVQPADVINVTAVNENEYLVSITTPEPIVVEASGQSGKQGLKGDTGIGIPPGGTKGQRLAKVDNVDFNAQWVDQSTTMSNKQVAFAKDGLFIGDEDFVFDQDLKALSIGQAIFLPDNPLGVSGDIDSYLQVNVQNKNGGVSASSDYVATADDGTDETHYADMGINGSNYENEDYSGVKAHDGYLLVQGGDLALASTGKINFLAEGFAEENKIGEVNAVGIDLVQSMKFSENGFNLTDLITEAASEIEEAAAFLAGAKIVIRTDLI